MVNSIYGQCGVCVCLNRSAEEEAAVPAHVQWARVGRGADVQQRQWPLTRWMTALPVPRRWHICVQWSSTNTVLIHCWGSFWCMKLQKMPTTEGSLAGDEREDTDGCLGVWLWCKRYGTTVWASLVDCSCGGFPWVMTREKVCACFWCYLLADVHTGAQKRTDKISGTCTVKEVWNDWVMYALWSMRLKSSVKYLNVFGEPGQVLMRSRIHDIVSEGDWL